MATTPVFIHAPPEAVWEVLSQPRSYAHWVVGSSRTLATQGRWPEPGSIFHHTQGFGRVSLHDTTEVIAAEPPHVLVLEVRVRPLLVARVELRLEPHGSGTWLTMTEHPFAGLMGRWLHPVLEPLLLLRNTESVRRLRVMAEKGETT